MTTPQSTPPQGDAWPSLTKTIQSNIGRVVAFLLTPVLLPVMGGLSFWLQKKLGIHMDPAVATGFVVSVVAGIALAGYKWLHNRGEYELAVMELHKVYTEGAAVVPPKEPPPNA